MAHKDGMMTIGTNLFARLPGNVIDAAVRVR